jgi:hypothetical protein
MTEFMPSMEFENKLRQALVTPEPDPAFALALRTRLAQSARTGSPLAPRRFRLRPAWGILLGLALLVVVAILAIGPQRVAAEMKKLFGYIPGFGIVEQNAPLRVLAEPVIVTRAGITVTVSQAFLTKDTTMLTYSWEGVPWSDYPHNETSPGCGVSSNLRLPDGTLLASNGGGGSAQAFTADFPPLPAALSQATFVLPCLLDTSPGQAPENWALSLRFIPVPASLTLMPVIDVTPSMEPQINTPAATAIPAALPGLYGLRLAVDKYIPLADGYYLLGHTDWTDARITSAAPGEWALKAYDSLGQELAIEPVEEPLEGLTLGPNQWLYHLYGKNFHAPITLRASQMDVTFQPSVRLTLDLRSDGFVGSDAQLGTVWKLAGLPLDLPGLPASVSQVTYMQQGDLKGFQLGITAGPALQGLPLTIESGLDISGLSEENSAGGSNRDEASGLVLSTILTNAKITFPLVMSTSTATVNGPWETSWNPPAGDPNATPSAMAQPCVTLEDWKQAASATIPLPAGLPMRVLLSRAALAPDLSLFIASPDGSTAEGLVFGQGSLSPDGTRLAYSGGGNAQENRLNVMDVSTKDSTVLTQGTFDLRPLWSPDGTQIAFSRLTSQGYNVFVMAADGNNVRALTGTTDGILAAGWTPDGRKVLAVTVQGSVQLLDVAGGAAQALAFIQQSSYTDVSISPDGLWIAYIDKVPGRMTPGFFISRLDGSDERLLIQLDTWSVSQPRWSPDGNWLAFSVMDTDLFTTPLTSGLVNVATCQVVPLKGLDGQIEGWAK